MQPPPIARLSPLGHRRGLCAPLTDQPLTTSVMSTGACILTRTPSPHQQSPWQGGTRLPPALSQKMPLVAHMPLLGSSIGKHSKEKCPRVAPVKTLPSRSDLSRDWG